MERGGLGTGDQRPLLGRGLRRKEIGGGNRIESVATVLVLAAVWVQRKGLGADGEDEKGRVAPDEDEWREGHGVSGGAMQAWN